MKKIGIPRLITLGGLFLVLLALILHGAGVESMILFRILTFTGLAALAVALGFKIWERFFR